MTKITTTEDFVFQLVEFYTENIFEKVAVDDYDDEDGDEDNDGEESCDDDDSGEEDDGDSHDSDDEGTTKAWNGKAKSREYKIYLFGRDRANRTVSVCVSNFTPYFYILIPSGWREKDVAMFKEWIFRQEGMGDRKRDFVGYEIVRNKSFDGFHNNAEYCFMKLVFKNTVVMRKAIEIFVGRIGEGDEQSSYWKTYRCRDIEELCGVGRPYEKSGENDTVEFTLYESNIDPLLRFLHLQDIEPCSWVRIPKGKFTVSQETACEVDISCDWRVVQPYSCGDSCGFVICSFDIETDSSHGDFPLAKKDYLKVARDLVEYWQTLLKDVERLRSIKSRTEAQEAQLATLLANRQNPRQVITRFLMDSFHAPYDPERQNEVIGHVGVYHIFTKGNEKPSDKTVEKVVKTVESIVAVSYTAATSKLKQVNIQRIRDIMRPSDMDAPDEGGKFGAFGKTASKPRRVRNTESHFPPVEGDHVRQIGLKFIRYGEKSCFKSILISYGTCDKIADTHVLSAKTEEQLLLTMSAVLQKYDPDFIIGYNIFNFDFPFLYDRADELGILDDFSRLGRLRGADGSIVRSYMTEKRGKVKTKYLEISGRIQIDIYKILQREQPNLDSYKLDNVSSHFIKSAIRRLEYVEGRGTDIYVDDSTGIYTDNYIHVLYTEGYTENKLERKYRLTSVRKDGKSHVLTIAENIVEDVGKYKDKKWSLAKDDLSPKDLFAKFRGTSADRSLIGKYCMMDVNLCIELLNKLQMITNNMGMANVCVTPLNWIFMRGQGVKILSLISKFCRKEGFLLPTLLVKRGDGQKYEGAFVLPPKPSVYLDDYITVLDYNSLYPSSMIAENLSHETYCGAMCRCEKHIALEPVTNRVLNYYEEEAKMCDDCRVLVPSEEREAVRRSSWLGIQGIKNLEEHGYTYEDIPHDIYHCEFTKTGTLKSKTKIGVRLCRFVQFADNKKGILPRILQGLLKARKDTRTRMTYETITTNSHGTLEGVVCDGKDGVIVVKDENFKDISPKIPADDVIERKQKFNDFQISVLEGLQLAFKVTANSLYGQIGARTSAVYLKDIAASTTATGRKQLLTAKDYVESRYEGAKVIYGDTDSIFVNFKPRDAEGNLLKGTAGLERSIALGKDVSKGIRQVLKNPQNLGYEKTFYPFIIFSKKRYVGNKYEEDPHKFKQASMGIVLKRRDNCPLVKMFYGGVIDILMNTRDFKKAHEYVDLCCVNLANGLYPIEKLTISKMLNASYKNPEQIAHKVLADRIGERESGNRPQNGDRIPYVYIHNPTAKLQADKIETPAFVLDKANQLKVDYRFYITNQISKPVGQIFALFIERLDPKRFPERDFDEYYRKQVALAKGDEARAMKRLMDFKLKKAVTYVFQRHADEVHNKQIGQTTLTQWFVPSL